MNKKALFPLTLLPLAATYLQAQNNGSLRSECTDKRPNIILFMVDDMGWHGGISFLRIIVMLSLAKPDSVYPF